MQVIQMAMAILVALTVAMACTGSNNLDVPSGSLEYRVVERGEMENAIAKTGTRSGLALQQTSLGLGIWVTGEGVVSIEPDLAILDIGVEAVAITVSEARDKSATAMDAIMDTLLSLGVNERDIQTRFFNISPLYEYQEIFEPSYRGSRQVLVGYSVINSANVKIRNLDSTGQIIDEVAAAGGDIARINGISFTVDDTDSLIRSLREQAVADAVYKATQLAELTGISLGKLQYMTEGSGNLSTTAGFDEDAFQMRGAMSVPTTVSPGALELRMSVRAVFGID